MMAFRRGFAALAVLVIASLFSVAAAQAPAAPRFNIQRFVVEGNSVLPQDLVDRTVAPFAGAGRDFGDVQRALEALQDLYTERGFSAVRVLVPEQDLVSGQVRLQVIEARIHEVKVEGNTFFDTPNVLAGLPALKPGNSPNTREISRNAQMVNENPAKQVSISLASGDEPTQIAAVVKVVDEKPSRVTLSVDDTGSSATGRLRTGIGYQHANLTNHDDVLSLQFITSPSNLNDVKVFGAGYHLPLYSANSAIDVFAGYSNVNSGVVQDLFAISGSGSVFGVRYTYFLPRVEAYEHKLGVGWDYRDFHQNVSLLGTSGSLVPDATVTPLSISYSGRYSRVGQTIAGYATYVQNLPGADDRSQNAITAQRAGARASYQIVRFGASISQTLASDFLLRAVFDAQYSKDVLIGAEQYGMGGANNVRGFFEREVSNDVGHRASAELYSPDFGAGIGGEWRARALAFIDTARGYDNVPQRGGKNGLTSTGIGLRMNQGKRWALKVDWAYVLNGAGSRPDGVSRVHFAAAYSF
jgi:hemolysin activation/secretion protein